MKALLIAPDTQSIEEVEIAGMDDIKALIGFDTRASATAIGVRRSVRRTGATGGIMGLKRRSRRRIHDHPRIEKVYRGEGLLFGCHVGDHSTEDPSDNPHTVPFLSALPLKTLFLAALLLLSLAVAADVLTGRVVRVVYGDTVYVLDAAETQHKIRLAGIDAPERGQPFSRRSKQRMAELVAEKEVEVDWYKEDRWGRLIGTVWVAAPSCRDEPCPKTLDAGLALITSGLSWHFKKYAHEQTEEDRERYAFGEEEARARKAGLWRDPEPVPPWEWRDRRRSR